MIYMFKLYDLKELRDFDLFGALEKLSHTSSRNEFYEMEEVDSYIKSEFDEGNIGSVDEPGYIVIVDTANKKVIKRAYTLTLKLKTFKTDEELQALITTEDNKVGEA